LLRIRINLLLQPIFLDPLAAAAKPCIQSRLTKYVSSCCPSGFSEPQEAARVLRAVMRSATHPQQQPSGEALCVEMVDVLVERAIEATNLPQVCHGCPTTLLLRFFSSS
jgi:hypothetical protein